ncbi:MAG TPA: Rha family transcriptional regulator, partial [Thiopseudomonas sp.]|nr:Rha family transcriptional regulator [Thiopseudomonas sp.]
MKNLTVLSDLENLTMSSLDIAKVTGKRHGHVIRDIRVMIKDLKHDPNMEHVSEDKDSRGYTKQMHLPQRETLILISGYSTELRAKIIDRWAELEIKEKARLQKEADRNAARLQAPQMSWALKESREAQGKPTPSHVYSNDYDMINIIVLGK